MKLTINKVNALLQTILPMTLDGMRPMVVPGGKAELHAADRFVFPLNMKICDVTNRKNLKTAFEVFEVARADISVRLTGKPDIPAADHPAHEAWLAEVNALADQPIDVKLRPYKLSEFNFEVNSSYPSRFISMLDDYGLIKFDVEPVEDAEELAAAPVAKAA
jgi:hypothetical protein